jgi:threonine dehydrogenase-like Zn-dependent dehydrogenase
MANWSRCVHFSRANRVDHDVVVDAAGTASSMKQAMRFAERAGRIILVALPWEPIAIPTEAVLKEVSVIPAVYYGVHGGQDEFHTAAEVLARNSWWAGAIVTHRFALSDAASAFQVATDRSAGAIKVHFTPKR